MGKDAKTMGHYSATDDLIRRLELPTATRYLSILTIIVVLMASYFFGARASMRWLALFIAGLGTLVLLRVPQLGLLVVIVAALIVQFEIGTGTEVQINVATLLVPALFGLYLLQGLRRRKLRWATSPVNQPLILFLLAGLLSFVIGNATWDPTVTKSNNFWLVQLSQWGIFVFAAFAFWLIANVRDPGIWLPRLTWTFLYLGGGLASIWMALGSSRWLGAITTVAFQRAPFWVLLTALAGGQLLFNADLERGQQTFLVAVLFAVLVYSFVVVDDRTSNWVGVISVAGVLIWLRLPRLRRVLLVLGGLMLIIGLITGFLYEFAGGDEKWIESGASRLVLIGRVVEVTMRNPITGLGPASYRPYANIRPLQYYGALWWNPQINSHNNYVDLFAHTGLLGLGLFLWFAVELWLLGLRLLNCYATGFTGGYVAGMAAAWIGSLIIMFLADWILPFVYNVGFPGFRASLLLWLFLGGLVAIDKSGRSNE
jgi:hypothetical protein